MSARMQAYLDYQRNLMIQALELAHLGGFVVWSNVTEQHREDVFRRVVTLVEESDKGWVVSQRDWEIVSMDGDKPGRIKFLVPSHFNKGMRPEYIVQHGAIEPVDIPMFPRRYYL